MDINYVFYTTRRVITRKEYNFDNVTYYTCKVENGLFYIKDNIALDLFSKEKLPINYTNLCIGEQFVDIQQLLPLKKIISEIENKYIISISLKQNMTRRQIIKLLKEISEKIQIKQQNKTKKMIKINKFGGKNEENI